MTADGEPTATLAPSAVAVIGLAARVPGAANAEELWDNLCAGRESIEDLSDEELRAEGVPEHLLRDCRYVKRAACVPEMEDFDASFFGFTPELARRLDPQQRIFLEESWHAIEDAGYDPRTVPGSVGVFATCSVSSYLLYNLLPNADLRRIMGAGLSTELVHLVAANDANFLATRVSHALDLRGPSATVQTACSSSLVAVHLACQHLLGGECDVAVTGGVSVRVPHRVGYGHDPGSIMSPDGRCRPFDADAAGTIFGSGAGVVVLKPLEAALRDGDPIRAVILGSAVNNDGSLKSGYTAPSVVGQAEVVAEALAVAGLQPAEVGYVEAHGTGTPLGDPIEVAALGIAYGARPPGAAPTKLGSVKANIGHLEVASGVVGLIKAVLMLEHRRLPPTVNFKRPNPELHLEATPFEVQQGLESWEAHGPLTAGVSSLGVGGTNAHVLLREAPQPAGRPARAPERRRRVYAVGAADAESLAANSRRLAAWLSHSPDVEPRDVVYTLSRSRARLPYRAVVVAADAKEAAAGLAGQAGPATHEDRVVAAEPRVALLFPGQGSQHRGMALGLLDADGDVRALFSRCAALFRPHLSADLEETIREGDLVRTDFAQPALFAVGYAIAAAIAARGVRPAALLGHSIGEYVAATVGGVLPLEAAVEAVAVRGRLMHGAPHGAMATLPVAEDEASEMATRYGLHLCAVNGPSSCVLGGASGAVRRLLSDRNARAASGRLLATAHAFHTPAMDDVADKFADAMARMPLQAPRLPIASNLTGEWMTPEEAVDPERWARQLRAPVRFGAGLETVLAAPCDVVVDVGPGRALVGMARSAAGWKEDHRAVALMRHRDSTRHDEETFLLGLGALWAAGVDLEPHRLTTAAVEAGDGGSGPRRCRLPGYAFRRDRHWIDSPLASSGGVDDARAANGVPTDGSAVNGGEACASEPETVAVASLADRLLGIWREVLGLAEVTVDDDFFDIGGDSVSAIQIAARADAVGLALAPEDVFAHPTVASLVEHARAGSVAMTAVAAQAPMPSSDPHRPPLTPGEVRLLQGVGSAAERLVMPLVLELHSGLTPERVRRALEAVAERHPILRLRLSRRHGGFVQEIASVEPVELLVVRSPGAPPRRPPRLDPAVSCRLEALTDELAGEISFDGSALWRAAYVHDGREPRLVIAFHHLLLDAASERLVLADLETACRQLLAGGPAQLPPATSAWSLWSQRVSSLASDPETIDELDRWLDPALAAGLGRLGAQRSTSPPGPQDVALHPESVDASVASALARLVRQGGVAMDAALLAGLAVAAHRTLGEGSLTVELEGQGRHVALPGVSLNRTVGSCTTVYPVALGSAGASPSRAFTRARDAIRLVPRQGLGYGVLRFLYAPTASMLAAGGDPDVILAYLGATAADTEKSGAAIRLDRGVAGAVRAVPACLLHALEIRAYRAEDGGLCVDWWHDRRRLSSELVAVLATHTTEALNALGLSADAQRSVASDDGRASDDGLTSDDGRASNDYVDRGISDEDLRVLLAPPDASPRAAGGPRASS
jgi:phthiocerol/phenolphthiocerol synthesis type-I polyketide synthase E